MNSKLAGLSALTAVLLAVLTVWYLERPVLPKQASWDDVVAEAERGGYKIISTEDLAKRFFEHPSGISLIDTRQEWEYRTGHIDGAVNFPMEPTWWSRWSKSDELEELLGPDKDHTLVFY
jgi:hypothetical protein